MKIINFYGCESSAMDAANPSNIGNRDHGEEEEPEIDNEQASLAQAFDQRVRPFIDLVDDLRRHGLERDIALPSAVVIGDQSSGKSSILEAISGVQLPRGSGIVTRCPLELQMKKILAYGGRWSAEMRYQPKHGQEKIISVDDPSNVEALIRQAQNEIAGTNRGISKNLITLRIQSPSCPDVTLIDLPGITRTPVGDQPADIPSQIKDLLTSYIEQENTIILCVIPSNVDIATNEALSMAKEVDPDGCRTLGVLTKPDLVPPGTESDVLAILNNDRFYLKKGYNILKCRGQLDIDKRIDLATAMEQEDQFFQRHRIFRQIDPEIRGTRKLSLKLTDTLVEHIQRTLPKMREDVRDKLEDVRRKLVQMREGPPTEEGKKRLFLMKTVDEFMKRVRKAFEEGDRIPEEAMTKNGRTPNWRSQNSTFHDNNKEEFNTFYFHRKRFSKFRDEVKTITKHNLKSGELSVKKIEEKMNHYRGRELPCFLDIGLFEELVQQHVQHYKKPIDECCKELSLDVERIVDHVLKNFDYLPVIRRRFRMSSEEIREECFRTSEELLSLEMEKEKLVYTQDNTFLQQLRRQLQKLRNNSNDHEEEEEKDFFSFSVGGSKAESKSTAKKNAEVLQRLLKMYLKVANRRVLDSVPMILRCKQHLSFLKKLHERLQCLCSGEEVDALVNEEPELERRRREAQARADRLSHAMQQLSGI